MASQGNSGNRLREWLPPTVCCAIFTALACLVMGYPGIQNDEALFGTVLYPPYTWHFAMRIFHRTVPIMLMSYMGTLKSLLYAPVFRIFAPSVASIRLPAVLAGAATVWIFFAIVCRIGGRRAAFAAAILLATDATFILTTTFDWGPVALQHLLLVAGVLSLMIFHRTRSGLLLGPGFFLFGLALWDKAIFVWPLAGLATAALSVFPREVLRHVSLRTVTIALISLIAGSAPLLIYNVKRHGDTIRANTSLSPANLAGKGSALRDTFDGDALLGYLTREGGDGHPRQPRDAGERVSLWLCANCGKERANYNELLFALAAVLLPFLWFTPARRPLLFALVFLFVTWIQMALAKGTGGSAHHVVLLWPFPFLFIGIALAEASRRFPRFGIAALAFVVTLAVGRNLQVFNEYRAQLIGYGAPGAWSDAIFPLESRLTAYRSRDLYVIDWGILTPLQLLGKGSLKLHEAWSVFTAAVPEEAGKKTLMAAIANPQNVFVANTADFEVFKGTRNRLAEWARQAGYEPALLESVADGNGRPVFEVYSFRAAAIK